MSASVGMPSLASSDPLPARIGPYRILRRLGVGGLAEVFAAEGPLGRVVALKSPADDGASPSLSREVDLLNRLDHPSIVRVFDSGHDVVLDRPYAAFELIEGDDLATGLSRRGRMAAGDAARLAVKLAEALGHVHDRGIVHLDVKPANVMAGAGRPVLIDFGVARPFGLSSLGAAEVGTPPYMAPERWDAPDLVGPASDFYALGATLYHLTTGRPHLGYGTPDDLAVRRRAGRYRPPSDVAPGLSKAFDRLIGRLLTVNPARRLGGAAAVLKELNASGLTMLPSPRIEEPQPDGTVEAADQPTLPGPQTRPWW